MICHMYPGQPLTHDAALPADADFTRIADLTRTRTGLDLASFTWNGEPGTEQTALQVYGTAVSLYRSRLLRSRGERPAIVAEHSMGVYAALAACGVIPEEAALELTCRIGIAMAGMAREREYALGCVVGLTCAPLLAVAEHCGVFLANHNTSRHFLLAGERPGP